RGGEVRQQASFKHRSSRDTSELIFTGRGSLIHRRIIAAESPFPTGNVAPTSGAQKPGQQHRDTALVGRVIFGSKLRSQEALLGARLKPKTERYQRRADERGSSRSRDRGGEGRK